MQYVPNLGELCNEDARRDAVHIAVAPVEAGEEGLLPGQRIGLINGKGYGNHPDPIGILDPLLKTSPNLGQKFWLWLFPNTVTSLRHVWTHPAFAIKIPIQTGETP